MTRKYYDLVDEAGQRQVGAWLTDEQAAKEEESHGGVCWRYRLAETRYRDDRGREVFVSNGISGQFSDTQITYAVYWRANNSFSQHRVKSKVLPIRNTHAEAQADLDAYAARKSGSSGRRHKNR